MSFTDTEIRDISNHFSTTCSGSVSNEIFSCCKITSISIFINFYSINECSIQIKEGNYEYNGTLSDILALVAENGRWLFVVTLGSEREPTRRKAPTSTIKNFMSGKALASQFSVTEFLSCVCYLTVDLFHDTYTREVNNATLQFWKSMFQFRQMIEG